jgi:hypothetical protein
MNPNAWWRRALRWVADIGLGVDSIGLVRFAHEHAEWPSPLEIGPTMILDLPELAPGKVHPGQPFPLHFRGEHAVVPIIYRGPEIKLPETCSLAPEFRGCLGRFKDSQWWRYCGETDMGSMPALCTQCGGQFELEPMP